MNFILDNWYLIVLALASGAMLLLPAVKGAAGGLSAAQAVQLINREKAVVIDVCEPAEFAAGHVGGAKNIPLAQLQGGRAARAVGIAKGLGYDKAQTLAGGLAAWREASMPVEKA